MEGHEVVSLGGVGHGEKSEGFFELTRGTYCKRVRGFKGQKITFNP